MPSDPAIPRHAARDDAEDLLWRHLRGRRLGATFRRRVQFGPFQADFACPARGVLVECDASPGPAGPYDRARDARLAMAGVAVLRFSQDKIRRDIDGVCAAIRAALARRRGARPRSPAAGAPRRDRWPGAGQ
jgi:very-short-patch-repair endonuclease